MGILLSRNLLDKVPSVKCTIVCYQNVGIYILLLSDFSLHVVPKRSSMKLYHSICLEYYFSSVSTLGLS